MMSQFGNLPLRFLDTAGYHVLAAKDGVEALQIVKDHGQSIGALLADVVMPKMRGTELAARLSNILPEMNVIFISGYLEHSGESHELVEDSVFLVVSRYLGSPFGSYSGSHAHR
jgi:two-component system cell cycle sensor histidine kinase/response regulator CckA